MLRSLALGFVSALMATSVDARQLVINTDDTNPAPMAAFEFLIEGFKDENPEVEVVWNNFEREGYKTSIRNFLTAEAPDVATWYAGNRMAPFVNAGLFEPVTDLWEEHGLNQSLKAAAASMEMNGEKWGVPYTYYHWGLYYRADIFAELGLEAPTTWDELLTVSAALKEEGLTPITIGTKALWPAAGWFDYINLRLNGYEHHMELTNGEIPYTDPSVQAVFEKWLELIEPGYFQANHAAYDWQEAVPFFVNGDAAMYLMGNFALDLFRVGGLSDDQIGFTRFPVIDPDVPLAEDAPTDTFHIPSGAQNKDDARAFLAYIVRPDVQTELNGILGQLPVNSEATVPEDPFLAEGFQMLIDTPALAQFYDRDAPAEMAKAGMEGFQEFMMRPGNLDRILQRLDRARTRIY